MLSYSRWRRYPPGRWLCYRWPAAPSASGQHWALIYDITFSCSSRPSGLSIGWRALKADSPLFETANAGRQARRGFLAVPRQSMRGLRPLGQYRRCACPGALWSI